jgi:hypothetical protein
VVAAAHKRGFATSDSDPADRPTPRRSKFLTSDNPHALDCRGVRGMAGLSLNHAYSLPAPKSRRPIHSVPTGKRFDSRDPHSIFFERDESPPVGSYFHEDAGRFRSPFSAKWDNDNCTFGSG